MKAERVQPPATIKLELTEREATILVSLVGGVVWDCDTEVGVTLRGIFFALDGLIPERADSYCDFFEGPSPRCKNPF